MLAKADVDENYDVWVSSFNVRYIRDIESCMHTIIVETLGDT